MCPEALSTMRATELSRMPPALEFPPDPNGMAVSVMVMNPPSGRSRAKTSVSKSPAGNLESLRSLAGVPGTETVNAAPSGEKGFHAEKSARAHAVSTENARSNATADRLGGRAPTSRGCRSRMSSWIGTVMSWSDRS